MQSIDIYADTLCLGLERHYWAVGAGLFTSQQLHFCTDEGIKTLNMVYDCGSHNQKLINREIDEYVSKINSDVDFLFISHLDKDHISGVKYLKSKLDNIGRRIKSIYCPFLAPSERFFLSLSPKNQGMRDVLLDIEEYLEQLADEVIYVRPENPESPDIINLRANSGEFKVWNFSFSVLPVYDKRDGFYDALSKRLYMSKKDLVSEIENPDFRDDLFIKMPNLLKQCYRNQRGLKDLNNTSLCVYSGPPKDFFDPYFGSYRVQRVFPISLRRVQGRVRCDEISPKPGWLGTGDAPLGTQRNVADFNKLFSDYKPHCESITVPHHGSKKNWHDSIMSDFPSGSYCFIGANGRYMHPSAYVISQINKLGHFSVNMRDDIHTRFIESYVIYY